MLGSPASTQAQEAGTATPTPEATETPQPEATFEPDPTETATPEATETAEPEPTETPKPEPSATAVPEPSVTPRAPLPGSRFAGPEFALIGDNVIVFDECRLVTVEVLAATAGYTNVFWRFGTEPDVDLGITNQDVGEIIEVGEVPAEEELILGILVQDTGYIYKTGPADRNPDGIVHAQFDGNTVGFEDVFGGGDLDFDDAVLLITSEQCPQADPVADFSIDYVPVIGAGGSGALEGSVVQFTDLSFDADEDIVSWLWTVTSPLGDSVTSTDQFPILIPPQQGSYTVSLTVTDSRGGFDTATSGEFIPNSEGTFPYLEVQNAPPVVDATDIEVIAGSTTELIGAFFDGGWLDTHTAAFTVSGMTPGPAAIDAVSDPALTSGVVTASLSVPLSATSTTGTLTVTDDFGGVGTDTFAVTVIADNPAARETNDAFSSVFDTDNPAFEAPAFFLNTDGSYLAHLVGADNRDFYELRWKGQNALVPQNSELLVSLAPPTGADYDLALIAVNPQTQALGQQFVGQQFVGQQFVGQQFVGQQFVGQQFVGQQFVGQQFVGQQFVGQQFVGQQFVGQQFVGQQFVGQQFVGQQFIGDLFTPKYEVNGFQLNALSKLAALDGSTVGSADLPLGELGLDLPAGVTVLGFAASSGDVAESLLVNISEPGTRVFAVVLRNSSSSSASPYRLTVRGSTDLLSVADAAGTSLTALNNAIGGLDDLVAACEVPSPLITSGATSSPVTLHDGGAGSPLTVFITQHQRLVEIYGEPAVAAMEAELFALADHPAVRGLVISVPSTIYDAWDMDPCNVQAANDVTEDIRALLTTYLAVGSSVENIVVVGNDNIVPFRRVADTTVVGNERNYALGTFLTQGAPLFHAVDGGFILTQDYYADRVPTPYEGGSLYVPDVAIGRLVETPGEIAALADAFVTSNGILDIATASVAGYDFFEDSANAVAGELTASGITTDTLINSGWTGADLRCEWGLDAATAGCAAAPDLSDESAHYTHWGALSAGGFFNEDYGDFVTGEEIAVVGQDGSFLGHLGFTIGCHAGFNAPDEDILAAAGLPFDPSLDFPQALAQARAIWVASTGYAIGDDEALNYTELLMLRYTQHLLGGTETAGGALRAAKQQYLGSKGTITNYDQKVSIEMTLYGLPQYQIDTPSSLVASQLESSIRTLSVVVLDPGPGDSVTETLTFNPQLQPVVTSNGTYHTENGNSESTVARPRMPSIVAELEEVPEGPVHGAILVGGSYTATQNFDPVIAAPLTEWGFAPPEPQVCLSIFWPSPVKLNAIGSDEGLGQRLIVYPAAFRCDTGAGAPVRGEYRLFSQETVRVYRSDSADFRPPTIASIQLVETSGGGVAVEVTASDADSGVGEVVVVRYRNGSVVSASTLLDEPLPGTATSQVAFADFEDTDEYVVHVVDGAGNIATNSAKGSLIQFEEPEPSGAVCSVLGNDPFWWLIDVDVFSVRGERGETVTIDLEAVTGGGRASFSVLGATRYEADNGNLPNQVSFRFNRRGVVWVVVAEQFGRRGFTGEYCMTAESSGNAAETLAPYASVE